MGFDKVYPKRKDWRRPYHGAKAIDKACRPGGSCPHCRAGQLRAAKARAAQAEIDEVLRERAAAHARRQGRSR